ncbi:hypothetical protein ACSSS7_007803 [Eimeria intestinalis]
MATAWILEDGSQLSIARTNEAPQGKANGNLKGGASSVGLNELLFGHRHAHKTLAGTSILALVLAALALTYLLVTCMRHLSKGLTLSSQQPRVLASNFPSEDEDVCHEPEGDAKQETEPADTEGSEPKGAGAVPLPGDLRAHGPATGAPAGRTRRVLSASVQTRVGRTLRLLERPATLLTPLIPLLRPDHCLGTVRTLCKIVALELSAFSTIPACLQPLRQQVAQVYSNLIEQVLRTEPIAAEAARLGWDVALRALRELLQRLAQVPPETERLPGRYYSTIVQNQRRVCHWMFSQVLNVLQVISFIKTQDPSPKSNEAVFMQRGVLHSLFLARRQQILRSVTLTHWLERQQRDLGVFFVYGSADLDYARHSPEDTLNDRLHEIKFAVVAAGGQPTSRFAHLPLLSGEQQQPQQQQPLVPQIGHHPHPGAPHAHPQQARGPLHMHFSPLPGQHTHPPAQPIPQAPHMPPPPPAAAQPPAPFDLVQQDSLFPAVNPRPQLSGEPQPPVPFLQIQLPEIYQRSYPSMPPLDAPSTSSSIHAPFGGLGASPSHGQPPGSAGQPQTPMASSQQTPRDRNTDLSSEEDDA